MNITGTGLKIMKAYRTNTTSLSLTNLPKMSESEKTGLRSYESGKNKVRREKGPPPQSEVILPKVELGS